ncbi:hypothetical protein ACF3DV_33845 (plasmid) [Chlorogloeopsis fritschii PCC 9212]|uniref:hypothetical protein n=1 Tax=Chlorogloeopsis fritschii TaxID=1124 RepID=UPI00370D6AAB
MLSNNQFIDNYKRAIALSAQHKYNIVSDLIPEFVIQLSYKGYFYQFCYLNYYSLSKVY